MVRNCDSPSWVTQLPNKAELARYQIDIINNSVVAAGQRPSLEKYSKFNISTRHFKSIVPSDDVMKRFKNYFKWTRSFTSFLICLIVKSLFWGP